jgi:hypothetical protein
MRIENRTSEPTLKSLSKENRTPLADTLRVRASVSSSPVDSTTGNVRGNRTAQRTSCRPDLVTGPLGEWDDSDWEKPMGVPA